MTKEQLAARLDGREHPLLNSEEIGEAKRNNLVIVYCTSTDRCEFKGAINRDALAPRKFYLFDGKLIPPVDETEYEDKVLKRHGVYQAVNDRLLRATVIEARWRPYGNGAAPCWRVGTLAPHAKFKVMEEGEVFCEAIVLDLKDGKVVEQ